MGGGNSKMLQQEDLAVSQLDLNRYRQMAPHATDREIQEIYRMFLDANPVNGEVRNNIVFRNYLEDTDFDSSVKANPSGSMNFDAFFRVMSNFLARKKEKHGPRFQFDAKEIEPQPLCFNCGEANK